MEQVSFVQEPLLFEHFKKAGWSTALVTAKEKLTKLLRRGLDVCVDMKTHPEAHRAAAGPPPEIFTLDINLWVFRMAREVALRERPDFLYVATTDYPQHMLAPDEPAMQRYLEASDEALGRLLDVYDPAETVVILTADHGMNAKLRSVSPVKVLGEAGHLDPRRAAHPGRPLRAPPGPRRGAVPLLRRPRARRGRRGPSWNGRRGSTRSSRTGRRTATTCRPSGSAT